MLTHWVKSQFWIFAIEKSFKLGFVHENSIVIFWFFRNFIFFNFCNLFRFLYLFDFYVIFFDFPIFLFSSKIRFLYIFRFFDFFFFFNFFFILSTFVIFRFFVSFHQKSDFFPIPERVFLRDFNQDLSQINVTPFQIGKKKFASEASEISIGHTQLTRANSVLC